MGRKVKYTQEQRETLKRERVEQATATLIEQFQQGDLPERMARIAIRRKKGDRPASTWSFSNQFILMMHGSEDARTYNAWQKVGRQVKKGPDTVWILRPVKVPIKEEDANGETQIIGWRTVDFEPTPRFKVEDTEGEPVVYPDYTPEELPPLMDLAERFGVKDVKYAPFAGDAWGSYHPEQEKVMLHTPEAKTWFHELAHHVDKLIQGGKLKGGQDEEQEIVAEFVAATLCEVYGFGDVRYSYDYIKGYAGAKDPAKAVQGLLTRIQKVLDKILEVENETKKEEK